jgi:ribosomal protein S18 acetylase RimI-like enzyme
MDVRLQIAEDKDFQLVLNYVRAYHKFEGIEDSEDISSSVRPLLGQSQLGRIWLIHTETCPVGYVAICFGYSIEFAGRDAFIDELFIVPEQRAKGIGKTALRLLKLEAASLGVNALHLEVARTNERARHLYASAGFEIREQFCLMSAMASNGTPNGEVVSGPPIHGRSSG